MLSAALISRKTPRKYSKSSLRRASPRTDEQLPRKQFLSHVRAAVAKFSRISAESGPMLPNSGQIRPKSAQTWQESVDAGQQRAKFARKLSKFGQPRPHLGSRRPYVGQNWPIWAMSAQTWPGSLCRSRPNLSQTSAVRHPSFREESINAMS